VSIDNNGQTINLGQSDLERVLDVMSQAWAEGTRETYGSGLLTFHVYCDRKVIPELQRIPTSHILLSTFISELAGAYSGKTIANYIYGIRAWHLLHGVSWLHNDPEIEALLKAATRLTPPSSKRKKRWPYTPDFMAKLKAHLNLQDPFDAATFACLTICFYSAGRVGEFTVTRLNDFDPTRHVTLKNLRGEEDRNGFRVTVLHLPRTKTSSEGEDVTWACQHGPTDLLRSSPWGLCG
jgi:site-specific recombinase XerD